MTKIVYTASTALALTFTFSIEASEETVGPKGINSIATGLTGFGVEIGQVGATRPGKFGFDTFQINNKVVPSNVFALDRAAGMNEGIEEEEGHSLWVASVMISKQTAAEPGRPAPIGVAQEANLSASAFVVQPFPGLDVGAALSAQAVANDGVWATNMSFGVPQGVSELDGTSTLTSFVDWSTAQHDVLYVVAGTEATHLEPIPSDNFNGITVAASARADDGFFRKVSNGNDYHESLDAVGERTSTDILAPGDRIDAAGANGSHPSLFDTSGTSFAAPHVTGTLALLHQQALTGNSRRHQTMKAVLLNSADKIKDVIGMERTVVDRDGHRWSHSDPNIPLDPTMGVGHLNANRAVQQHGAGEFGPGNVPPIGWDYFVQDDPFIDVPYILDLNAGDYVSATLVWDRQVFLNSGNPNYEPGDGFTDLGFENLDLHLVHVHPGGENVIASSTSTAWNLEHIFTSVPADGFYHLRVDLTGFDFVEVPYALAWWAGADERPAAGDFNGDNSVNAADYVVWRKTDGSTEGYNEWRSNFGNIYGSGSLASVPESSSVALLVIGVVLGAFGRRRA